MISKGKRLERVLQGTMLEPILLELEKIPVSARLGPQAAFEKRVSIFIKQLSQQQAADIAEARRRHESEMRIVSSLCELPAVSEGNWVRNLAHFLQKIIGLDVPNASS